MGLTKKQQAMRRTGVGASEIAVLAGLSKWSSPVALYERKVLGAEVVATYSMDLGTEIEAPIARVWAKRNLKHLALVDTLRLDTHPLALATPDRAIYSDPLLRGDARKKRVDVRDADALLQVKSTNWRMRSAWGEPGTDQIPDEYLCQAHWEGTVAGLSEVIFAVDFDKTELFEYRVKVSSAVFEGLYDLAARFFRDHVEPRIPPPPDGTPAWGDYLTRAFPRDVQAAMVTIEPGAEPDVERAVAEFLLLKAADKRLKARKERAYQIIANRIGEAAGLEGSFGRVTWKRTKDSQKVAWKARAEQVTTLVREAAAMLSDNAGQHFLTRLAAVEAASTETVPGHRTMRTTAAPHLEWDGPIELTLEPAPRGLDAGEEVAS